MDAIRTDAGTGTEAPSAKAGRFAKVYKVLQDAVDSRAFPGCAFGVLAGGEVALADALGSFTYEQDSPVVGPETVFDVASPTKVVATTAIAMVLLQRGELSLDLPIGELLPGFVIGRENSELARRVMMRHLLAHNSGIPGYVEFFRRETTASGLFRACLGLPVEATPGDRCEYSDPGFILLGKALEILNSDSVLLGRGGGIFLRRRSTRPFGSGGSRVRFRTRMPGYLMGLRDMQESSRMCRICCGLRGAFWRGTAAAQRS